MQIAILLEGVGGRSYRCTCPHRCKGGGVSRVDSDHNLFEEVGDLIAARVHIDARVSGYAESTQLSGIQSWTEEQLVQEIFSGQNAYTFQQRNETFQR